MNTARLNETNHQVFIFQPVIVSALTENLVNEINNLWKAFAQLETSQYFTSHGRKMRFDALRKIISDINSTSSKNHCIESLEALSNEISDMVDKQLFVLKTDLEPHVRIGGHGFVYNLTINLIKNITELKSQLLQKHEEISNINIEEKIKTPESKQISQLSLEIRSPIFKKEQNEIQVPGDVLNIALDYEDPSLDKVRSHGKFSLVDSLFNSIKTQKLMCLKDLLIAIVSGELDKVETILKKEPSLLLEKLEENDSLETPLSHQRFNNATAYRTALAVEDTQMAAMIKAKLIEIAGEDVANTQYRDQFPNGWEDNEEKRWAPVFAQLDTLTHAIIDAELPVDIKLMNDTDSLTDFKLALREESIVANELKEFTVKMEELLQATVTTGRHFNPNLLLTAYKIYRDHYDDDITDLRKLLFWQKVIGKIQCNSPINTVQAFCSDLNYTAKKLQHNLPQNRRLKVVFSALCDNKMEFIDNVYSDLGIHYAIKTCDGMRFGDGQVGIAAPHGFEGISTEFEDYSSFISIKNSKLRALYAPSQTKTLSPTQ